MREYGMAVGSRYMSLESRPVEGGRGAGDASHGDEKKGSGT